MVDVLPGSTVLRLPAAEGHRLLRARMPGHDGFRPTPGEEPAMIDALVGIQLASAERVDDLLAAGVPDLRTCRLVQEMSDLVERLAPVTGFSGPSSTNSPTASP